MWHISIHTMWYYLALKRKEVLTCAAPRVSIEDIALSEISQSQKGKKYMILYIYEVPRRVQFIEMESRMVTARGWRGGNDEELLFNGYEVSV